MQYTQVCNLSNSPCIRLSISLLVHFDRYVAAFPIWIVQRLVPRERSLVGITSDSTRAALLTLMGTVGRMRLPC